MTTPTLTSDSFWLPRAVSTIAGEVDFAWNAVLAVSTFFFLVVVTAIVFFVFRYRRRSEAEMPDAPTHNTKLEVIWTAVPLVIVMVLFAIGFRGFLNSAVAPAESLEVHVTGERWLWTFSYPDGTTSINELRVPRGRPVKRILSSKDVIHSFYVPEFRLKKDAVPGKYTTLWFEAKESGTLQILCAEYCGTNHAQMLATLEVMEEGDFQKWLETGGGDKDAPPMERGQKLFVKMACSTCHSVDGTAGTGPTLKGVFSHPTSLASGQSVVADENYLRESIANPNAKVVKGYQPVMPVFKGLLDQKQIDALVEYIKSLK